jgi:hypothetical protein
VARAASALPLLVLADHRHQVGEELALRRLKVKRAVERLDPDLCLAKRSGAHRPDGEVAAQSFLAAQDHHIDVIQRREHGE